MSHQTPKWWQVYAIVPLAIGLFTIEARSAMSATGHRDAQLGIVFLVFVLIRLWSTANQTALIHENLKTLPKTWKHQQISVGLPSNEALAGEPVVAEAGRRDQVEPEPPSIGRFRFNPRVSLN